MDNFDEIHSNPLKKLTTFAQFFTYKYFFHAKNFNARD